MANVTRFACHTLGKKILASQRAHVVASGCWRAAVTSCGNFGGHHRQHHSDSGKDTHHTKTWTALTGLAAVAVGTIGAAVYQQNRNAVLCAEPDLSKYGTRKPGLPIYRRSEVAKHSSRENRIWVTYKNGVYDITDFVEGHPGGDSKILLAAGKDLEMFYDTYAVHKSVHVMEILDELRIGNVHEEDMKDQVKSKDDPFANDPKRHPALRINSEKPFNAEPPTQLMIENFLTPNDLFFIRNHLPVPRVNLKSHRLEVQGKGLKKSMSFTIDEMKKKFKVHTITATLQCAGNRRSEMANVKSVKGLSWGTNAISNAEWTGVKLSDILDHIGAKEDNYNHVIFEGADKDMEGTAYEASVPAETAFDPRKDVLLAWQMNGKDLPVDHGYPLRVIIPGVVGARQVKWLNKIILSETESQGHFQQKDYKSFNPSIDWHNVDFSKSPAIQEYPIQSAICEPLDGATIEDSEAVTVKGYAWSGGGRGIVRVDVSIDGGKTWQSAQLEKAGQKLHREWAWTLWEADIPIPENQSKELDIVCKAIDSSHNVQPESAGGIWNLRGLINNAWQHIHVNVPK